MVDINDSVITLSQGEAIEPIDRRIPRLFIVELSMSEQYWEHDLSGESNPQADSVVLSPFSEHYLPVERLSG